MASLYENLNTLGRTTTKMEGVLLWILAALLLAAVVHVAIRRRNERKADHLDTPEYAKLSMLIAMMVLCGSLMFTLSAMNTPFARVLRAFSAGSLMAAPFLP